MTEYNSRMELTNLIMRKEPSFRVLAPGSLYHNGRDFEFHGMACGSQLLGHYHIQGRYEKKRRPKDSEYRFPASDPETLSWLVHLAEMPFSSAIAHGLFSYPGDEKSLEGQYLRFFSDEERRKQLEQVIIPYRSAFEKGGSFELENYPDIINEIKVKNFRDITITKGDNIIEMRISAYVTGERDCVDGIFFAIYNAGLMNHKNHHSLMEEAFNRHRPEGFIMPVGGSYLSAISYDIEQRRFLVGITGERSKNNGWIYEPLQPILHDLIHEELLKRSNKEEVYLVCAIPNGQICIQRT